MHPALLIDEILQLIFEEVLNTGKSSLCCVARCCQAWKNPALDRIWRRLPSAVPLLSLLADFSLENGSIRLGSITQAVSTAFQSHATRVRHIVHCHRILVESTSISILSCYLSNLESARIEKAAIEGSAMRMSMGSRLRHLVLQIGFAKSNTTPVTAHSMMSLLKGCPSLEQLSVRGHSSECLDTPLSGITTLRSLSLHLSFLTEQSFLTVSSFPLLIDLDVHADRLSSEYLSSAITRACDVPFFPALEKLKIRGQPEVIATILRWLPRNILRSLHIDVTGPSSSSVFEGLFNAISTLSLHTFTLEHTINIDEPGDIPPYTSDKFFTLDCLQPLSKLPLRCFTLDSPLPLDLSDTDLEKITIWWPHLEQLQLGARSVLENAEATWKPRNSLVGLCVLASGCRRLKSLVLALGVDSPIPVAPGSFPLGPHPLASLSISSRSRPDVSSLSAMFSGLFPSLVDLTAGFVGEYGDACTTTSDTF